MSTAASTPVSHQHNESAELYQSDPFTWSVEQSDALRRRDFAAVDWDNVIEEIRDVGNRHRDAWVSECANAIRHLLKIEHCRQVQPYELKDWEREIPGFRAGMEDATEETPGLISQLSSMFRSAWRKARRKAVLELAEYDVEHKLMPDDRQARKRRRLTLPAECPYRFEHVTGISFKRGDNKPHYDDSVLPPQVQRILDERTRNSPDLDR